MAEGEEKFYNRDECFLVSKIKLRKQAKYSGEDWRDKAVSSLFAYAFRSYTDKQWKLAEEGKYWVILDIESEFNLFGLSYLWAWRISNSICNNKQL